MPSSSDHSGMTLMCGADGPNGMSFASVYGPLMRRVQDNVTSHVDSVGLRVGGSARTSTDDCAGPGAANI